jgi:hypothetical protein
MRAWKTMLLIMIFSASGAIAQQSTATPPAELAPSQEPPVPAPPQLPPAPPSPQTSDLSQDAPAPAMPAPAPAQSIPAPSMPAQNMDQVIDRAIEREHALLKMMHSRTPLVETYVQDVKAIRQGGSAFTEDHYFLGRLDLAKAVNRHDYLRGQRQMLGGFSNPLKRQYNPMGFSWMIFADRTEFDRKHYKFNYLRREFLGDVRCIVFDVVPKRASAGRFVGRIWVEDQQYNIVRLNGSYVPTTTSFRMDSWRLNLIPGYWIPAYIYSAGGDFSYGSKTKLGFKAQSRIWGYDLKGNGKEGELTQLRLDTGATDESAAAQDATPLQAQRDWQEQAEGNVVERLQNAGLLAPAGEVDKVLETVANNLVVTNNLDIETPIKVRIMMTTPFETFSVGNTIVVSRGLVDVLPDEASLAMVLSHELAHIFLGHNHGEQYAFSNIMLFSDEATYQNLGFRHSPEDETAADKKAMELLQNSPYKDKLAGPGLFLKALAERAPSIPGLLTPHLGDRLVDRKGNVLRLVALIKSAPALDPNKLDQLAALPLGGRIKVNAWDDRLTLIKTPPAAINSSNDKLPFDVTPFFPRLTRYGTTANSSASATASR